MQATFQQSLDPGLGRESGSGRATSVAPVGADRMLSFMSSGETPGASQCQTLSSEILMSIWRRKSLKAMAACAHALLQLLRVTGNRSCEITLCEALCGLAWPWLWDSF